MGIVYEAIHDEIGRHAAIKVLSPRCADDPRYVRRFLNEARTISRVRHPGLVQIYDFGQMSSGAPYILMERLDGETLRSRMARRASEGGRLTIAEVRRVARQSASALVAISDAGIVHRDLKPENVMLIADEEAPDGERVKLLDFGIARCVESQDVTLTAPGVVLGTTAYMSPEQCAGDEEIGAATDVYALGVMLYELLAGEPPFCGRSSSATMLQHISAEPSPLPASAPPDLAQLVARMLAKEPTRRPSMRDVARALANARSVPAAPHDRRVLGPGLTAEREVVPTRVVRLAAQPATQPTVDPPAVDCDARAPARLLRQAWIAAAATGGAVVTAALAWLV
jgi:serine/threonine-protein kinase